ncbi:hypothetical protein SS50377_27669 [Spironucleus salmonicida]|uniref:Uncharacterized protein n=1 Tax=Spironucleus salmonicida TaxID=348837 RepID=A0A9P8LNH2_9EUKA|nr:hypothetical protein SS50377_27669 [Spironucleus salmonicida]
MDLNICSLNLQEQIQLLAKQNMQNMNPQVISSDIFEIIRGYLQQNSEQQVLLSQDLKSSLEQRILSQLCYNFNTFIELLAQQIKQFNNKIIQKLVFDPTLINYQQLDFNVDKTLYKNYLKIDIIESAQKIQLDSINNSSLQHYDYCSMISKHYWVAQQNYYEVDSIFNISSHKYQKQSLKLLSKQHLIQKLQPLYKVKQQKIIDHEVQLLIQDGIQFPVIQLLTSDHKFINNSGQYCLNTHTNMPLSQYPVILTEALYQTEYLKQFKIVRRQLILSYIYLNQCQQCNTQIDSYFRQNYSQLFQFCQRQQGSFEINPSFLLGVGRDHLAVPEQSLAFQSLKTNLTVICSGGYLSERDVFEINEGLLQRTILNALKVIQKHAEHCEFCSANMKQFCYCGQQLLCCSQHTIVCQYCGSYQCKSCGSTCFICQK